MTILKTSVSVSKIETGYTESQPQHAKTGLAHHCIGPTKKGIFAIENAKSLFWMVSEGYLRLRPIPWVSEFPKSIWDILVVFLILECCCVSLIGMLYVMELTQLFHLIPPELSRDLYNLTALG